MTTSCMFATSHDISTDRTSQPCWSNLILPRLLIPFVGSTWSNATIRLPNKMAQLACPDLELLHFQSPHQWDSWPTNLTWSRPTTGQPSITTPICLVHWSTCIHFGSSHRARDSNKAQGPMGKAANLPLRRRCSHLLITNCKWCCYTQGNPSPLYPGDWPSDQP